MKTQFLTGWMLLGGLLGGLSGCSDTGSPSNGGESVGQEAEPVTGNLNSSPPVCGAAICSEWDPNRSDIGYCCVCAVSNIYDSNQARMVHDESLTPNTGFCRASYEQCSKYDGTGQTLGHACTCAARSITSNGYMINDVSLTPRTYYCRAP
jgi:hypothetical protein